MNIIPQVTCRRCGEKFSSLRSRCPSCGTRRVSQSGRTPGTTPSTVNGTPSYERAVANTKWQMIFGLILIVAVILAVIVMVSTSLDNEGAAATKAPATSNIVETPTAAIQPQVETPTPPPATPTPDVKSVDIYYYTQKKEEFTMIVGDEAIPLTAVPYPLTAASTDDIVWTVDDESVATVTVTESGVDVNAVGAGTTNLRASCFGVEAVCIVRVRNP